MRYVNRETPLVSVSTWSASLSEYVDQVWVPFEAPTMIRWLTLGSPAPETRLYHPYSPLPETERKRT